MLSRHRNMSASSSSDRQRKATFPGHVGSRVRENAHSGSCVFHLSLTGEIINPARQPTPSPEQSGTGGDKTDTPTDMLHKEAQVAFKILMTH